MTNDELLAEVREFARHDNPHALGTPVHIMLDRPQSGWWFVPRALGTLLDDTWVVLGDARTHPAPDVPNAFLLKACFALRSKVDPEPPFGLELLAVRDDDSTLARLLLFERDGLLLCALGVPVPDQGIVDELVVAVRERITGWEMVKPTPITGAALSLADRVLEELREFEVFGLPRPRGNSS